MYKIKPSSLLKRNIHVVYTVITQIQFNVCSTCFIFLQVNMKFNNLLKVLLIIFHIKFSRLRNVSVSFTETLFVILQCFFFFLRDYKFYFIFLEVGHLR